MFRITCFSEDKNLARTLRALAAVSALNVESTPVVNAEPVGGKVRSKEAGGKMADLLWASDIKKMHTVSHKDLKQLLRESGYKEALSGYVISQLKQSGKLKKTKQRGEWAVVNK